MSHDVFICYANQDKKIANEVYSTLKKNSITCWMAPQDIMAGEDWDKAIMDAIPVCHIVVLVFSTNSNDSPYCISEIRTAFDLKKEIIPILIDDTLPHGRIALYLGSKQWLYANTPPLESHLKRLVDEVQRHLSQIKAREEAAIREKAQQEAETAQKAKEAEEKAREKAAEAKAAREAAVKAKKEAEEAIREKEQQEAAIAEAKKKAKEARDAREAAIKARKEAEEAIKEKEREEAETARIKKEAATLEAERKRRALETARKNREDELKAVKELKTSKPSAEEMPRKPKVWIWTSIGTIVGIIIIVLALKFTIFSGEITTPGDGKETAIATGNIPVTTTLPIPLNTSTLPTTTTTPTTTTAATPDEYVAISYLPTTFDKNEVSGDEIFIVSLSGNFTCQKDIPYSLDGLYIMPKITARNIFTGNEITLITSNNITSEYVPQEQGETVGFLQTLLLKFPEQAETGTYRIYLNAESVKVNIGGFWVDIKELLKLEEQFLGTVKYNE